MNIIVAVIIGGLVGWVASQIGGRKEGIGMSIVIGVIGAFLGSFLSGFLFGQNESFLSFTWMGLFWSLIGSLILVTILNVVQKHSNQQY